MRLIRTVLRPVNTGLPRQLQQRQVIKISSDLLHPVLIQTSSLDHGSNIQWCGRSYAASASASASSESLEPKKARRRVSKDERKSIVENYVNKYREMNAGKFPTVSDAKKDVGGGYYAVRGIIQEMKYKSKMSSVDSKDASLDKSVIKKGEISTNIEEVSQARVLEEPTSPISKISAVDGKDASSNKSAIKKDETSTDVEEVSKARELEEAISPILKVDTEDSSSKRFNSNERPQSSISVEDDKSKDVGTRSHRSIDEPESSPHLDPENNKHDIVDGDKKILDAPKSEPQESTETSERELQKMHSEDAEHQRKSSVWQNLKSFANGILDMWKRS